MRDYAQIRPRFWTHGTGKVLRGDIEARMVALYLVSSPTSNLIGMYYLPVSTLAHELGLPFEGASKALRRVCDTGFAAYDHDSEYVWVVNMAREQVGDEPNKKDNRIAGVRNELKRHTKCPFYASFCELYSELFGLQKPSPSEAPCKPLEGARESGTGTGTGTGTERERGADAPPLELLPHEPAPEPATRKPRDEAKLLWASTLKAESEALGIPRPEVGGKIRDAVIRQAREWASQRGESFASVLRAWVAGGLKAHVDTGKEAHWALKDWRPYGARAAPTSKRIAPAPGTTSADFADAEDFDTQLERLRGAL